MLQQQLLVLKLLLQCLVHLPTCRQLVLAGRCWQTGRWPGSWQRGRSTSSPGVCLQPWNMNLISTDLYGEEQQCMLLLYDNKCRNRLLRCRL